MGWAFGFGSALSLTSLSSVSVHHSHPPAPHKIPANATAIDIPDVPIGVADPLSAEESHNRGWSASFKSGFVNAFHSAFGIRGNQEGKGQGRDGEKEDGLTRGPSRNRRLSERLGRKGTKTSSFTSWTIPESLSGEGLSEYDSGEKGGMEGELGGGRMHEAEKGLEREWIEYWGGELVGVAPGSASPGETEKLGKGLGLGLGLDPDQEHEHELTSTSESLIPAPAPLVIRKKSPSKTGSVSVSKRGTVKSVYSTYSTYSTRSGRSRTSMRSRTGVSRANSIMSVLDEKEEMAGRALRERWSRRKAIQEGREEEPEPGVES
ncbi:hypothetical protein K435DRAFT_773292 [Dendrothele bispora CBS 962.96]|uniref:Uncharacterized protein n=1 Tax=Dendrothele bispora (strain CBS 962.96) TaxID=1314807 RepID=A0A4S8MTS5_DENBC|nr:hypothetical protein K435DRAFT_773292 [Dendrothele bispora CBS 962.96]